MRNVRVLLFILVATLLGCTNPVVVPPAGKSSKTTQLKPAKVASSTEVTSAEAAGDGVVAVSKKDSPAEGTSPEDAGEDAPTDDSTPEDALEGDAPEGDAKVSETPEERPLAEAKKTPYSVPEDHFLKPGYFELAAAREVKRDIEAGANVNAKNEDGITPLLLAVDDDTNPHISDVVKLLVAKGADKDAEVDGDTPRKQARFHSDPEIRSLLGWTNGWRTKKHYLLKLKKIRQLDKASE